VLQVMVDQERTPERWRPSPELLDAQEQDPLTPAVLCSRCRTSAWHRNHRLYRPHAWSNKTSNSQVKVVGIAVQQRGVCQVHEHPGTWSVGRPMSIGIQ